MKKIDNDVEEQKIEIIFDKLIMLLDYLREKDIFERSYQRPLAQRLLSNKPILDNMEKNMILRLKTKCSSQFTNQLKGMLEDIFVSNAKMNEFRHYVDQKSLNMHRIDLSVLVLKTGLWPFQSTNYQYNLPQMVYEVYQYFQSFYLNMHSGRRLILQPSLGTADLTAVFYDQPKNDDFDEGKSQPTIIKMIKKREHTLQVSTYQMIILMLFNTKESWSFEEIHQETNISEKSLERALLPLIKGNITQQILFNESNNNNIQSSDRFYVNDSFTSKLHRIKIKSIITGSENDFEQRETRKQVQRGRRHEIDAAIVRIMKTHKTMGHSELITGVINQLKTRFQVDPHLIKQCIERLIESDYLLRSKDDAKIYNYVA
ncbi:unnamed protein product [Rotaria sordida]|uniref:Cullin family profile domain-containing protein n=1 Tax=Rotaria sordida TaxID=392033 RepID=A0A815S7B5_9BILA|nr:unnamed protein product [Rotaria sordida]CAF1210855.1 unnamed protein product [Rotaria sordida]CAF1487068.1 unnamed protein product [Rotaria sordida]CAF1487783.1 unnamed protein product [Rotaria sordida]